MILYHGSLVAVEAPQILRRTDGRGADFGSGFYTTSSYEQAEKWVHIKLKNSNLVHAGYISIYEVPDNLTGLPGLSVKVFANANREWLQFVIQNRNNPDFSHHCDIVTGPVANDRVYTTLTLFEEGFIDEESAISKLKSYTLADQYLFHTEKSLELLNFLKAEEIR